MAFRPLALISLLLLFPAGSPSAAWIGRPESLSSAGRSPDSRTPAASRPTSRAPRAIELNQISIPHPPAWLKKSWVKKVVRHAERFLEWDLRKIRVEWYTDEKTFESAHRLGPGVAAVSFPGQGRILMGPTVNSSNFQGVLGHELTHVILAQKYGGSVPRWLEEGLANRVGKRGAVDYGWLSHQTLPPVHSLGHPFKSKALRSPRLHYQVSTAAMEMIISKCPIHDLLQLSVGKKLETYLGTLCGIPDVDVELKKWVERKKPRSP